jgi:carbonic anhydrase
MANIEETFFTVVGCMDGRVQEVTTAFGKQKFGALYPDKITEAGMVGIIATKLTPEFSENLKEKILISLEKHGSRGILVDGHEDCAGNPVSDGQQKEEIKKSVDFIRALIQDRVPVVGVFVHRAGDAWRAEEI